nr:hypothetical protein [Streptomyces massasporeus]
MLPGGWSEADLRYQAEHIATQKLHHNGYNCVASQAVVVNADWVQKDRFLAHLRTALADAPARSPRYPGSDDRGRPRPRHVRRRRRTARSRPRADHRSRPGGTRTSSDHGALRPRPRRVETPPVTRASSAPRRSAPRTRSRTPLRHHCVERLGRCRLAHRNRLLGCFPGAHPRRVQSGIGVVHNTLLLDGPERTVVRSPFHPAPQALLHGVQLDRVGTLGTDAARPSLPVLKRQHPPHPAARLCARRPAGRARLRANSSPRRQGGVGAWLRPRGSQLSLWPGSHLVPASSGPEAPHGVDFPMRRESWTRRSSQRVGEAP